MRTEEIDGGVERQILIGFITSTLFLGRVVPKWQKDSFKSRYSNIIAEWCVRHYRKYQKAPNKDVVGYFERWSQRSNDEDLTRTVERLLSSLSAEADQSGEVNVDYVIDLATTHFNETKLEREADDVRKALRAGDVKGALELRKAFREVNLKAPAGINLLSDREGVREAIELRQKPLVKWDGPLGEFFGNEFAEDSFVAFSGVPKGMKSYFLLDTAWRGMLQRKRVAYIQVGDMTLNQIRGRFIVRAAGRPLEPGLAYKPTVLTPGEDYQYNVERETRVFDDYLSTEKGQAAFDSFAKKLGKEYLRLAYYPIKTVSILDIQNLLAEWDKEGWPAQIVVVDYFENLAPVDKRMGPVEQIAETWAIGRQISEVRKCLVVTASQTNKEGFKARVQTRSNFRGSLMTLGHVTAFIGINQTDEEKTQQLARVNFMVGRNIKWPETKCCVVAGALDYSRPVVLSQM